MLFSSSGYINNSNIIYFNNVFQSNLGGRVSTYEII